MEWFQGSIADAVQTSKTRKAYFVVYVEGTDNASKTTTEVLNKPSVANKLKGTEFVAVKLLNDSPGHRQFADIYKMVPVPSVFFIGQTGHALEVVIGNENSSNVESRLIAATQKCLSEAGGDTAPPQVAASVHQNSSVSGPSSTAPEQSTSTVPTPTQDLQKAEPAKEINDSNTTTNDAAVTDSPNLDERVEKAKQLISQNNEEKKKESAEKERAAERERRRIGKELNKAKLNRQEQEMKEAMEEKKKSSMEDAAARKKILDQIAQDRADRLERERMRAPQSQPAEPMATSTPVIAPSNADSARIQFRSSTGEQKTHVFPAETKISEIRQFIDNNIVLPFREYQLATPFPRREFTWRDNEQDLRSLQLLPSAVILIHPIAGNTVVRPNGWAKAMVSLFWSLVTPLINIGNYVSSFIFGGGRAGPPPTNSSQRTPPSTGSTNSQQSAPQQPPSQPQFGSRTTVRRRGNIHTLGDESDTKDDNNTWNGNSTQQM